MFWIALGYGISDVMTAAGYNWIRKALNWRENRKYMAGMEERERNWRGDWEGRDGDG